MKFIIFFAVLIVIFLSADSGLEAQELVPVLTDVNTVYKNITPIEKNDRLPGNTVFNVKLLGVLTANENSTAYYTYGYGVSPSVHFKMGSVLTFFTELTVCRMKYIEKENTSSSSLTLSESMELTFLMSFGAKIYPFNKQNLAYGKVGLGILGRESTKLYKQTITVPPVIVLGFGYEIPISKLFSISPEFQTNIIGKTAEFSLGAGIIIQP
ncbi:MAG: hypothetical protein LWX07_06765 [Bacteroidetes bacterium]|nr:hypothetical protein [Bacteroidota bacterium]